MTILRTREIAAALALALALRSLLRRFVAVCPKKDCLRGTCREED
jgi:hypothetical protein